jgi:hypothetical protein
VVDTMRLKLSHPHPASEAASSIAPVLLSGQRKKARTVHNCTVRTLQSLAGRPGNTGGIRILERFKDRGRLLQQPMLHPKVLAIEAVHERVRSCPQNWCKSYGN